MLGGLSPLAVAAIKAGLPAVTRAYAPAIWLLCLGGITVVGTFALGMYMPRIARPHIGRVE